MEVTDLQELLLDEAMKGIMCLSSKLADFCQRNLWTRVWNPKDPGALELRLTEVFSLYTGVGRSRSLSRTTKR